MADLARLEAHWTVVMMAATGCGGRGRTVNCAQRLSASKEYSLPWAMQTTNYSYAALVRDDSLQKNKPLAIFENCEGLSTCIGVHIPPRGFEPLSPP
jgi:hypothetical protein